MEPAKFHVRAGPLKRLDKSVLAVPSAAFFASDCRFEAGFGSSPGSGNLFRTGALVARLERSVVAGPFSSVYESGAGKTTVFADSRFLRMSAGFERAFEAPPEGVRFERCTADAPLTTRDAPL